MCCYTYERNAAARVPPMTSSVQEGSVSGDTPAAIAQDVLRRLDAKAEPAPVSERIRDVYAKVAVVMARYRTGRIPKAFKIIPRLANWEEMLALTQPDAWTPHATYQAARVFMSALSPRMAEVFLSAVLLPKVRDDIAQHKKLNSHLYEALKKALYKPAAFYRGVVLPLCASDGGRDAAATLREATIVASVLGRMTVPVLHSAAALLRLSEQPYSGARSIFIKTLLDKRYALPERVLSAVHAYFMRFEAIEAAVAQSPLVDANTASSALPVLWHQSLLVFAQRYKHELGDARLRALRALVSREGIRHHAITPEIVREIDQGFVMQA